MQKAKRKKRRRREKEIFSAFATLNRFPWQHLSLVPSFCFYSFFLNHNFCRLSLPKHNSMTIYIFSLLLTLSLPLQIRFFCVFALSLDGGWDYNFYSGARAAKWNKRRAGDIEWEQRFNSRDFESSSESLENSIGFQWKENLLPTFPSVLWFFGPEKLIFTLKSRWELIYSEKLKWTPRLVG